MAPRKVTGGRKGKRPSPLDDLFPMPANDGKASAGAKSFLGFRCHETHPPLNLPGGAVIRGGACTRLPDLAFDVRIGFDAGMEMSPQSLPWTPGHEFLFKIRDMKAPADEASFRAMCLWTLERLGQGDTVHCGCIGGHGRTGTFLAALCALEGEADPIAYVRERYCHKAVESAEQVAFLVKHYGAKPAKGAKAGFTSKAPTSSAWDDPKWKAFDDKFDRDKPWFDQAKPRPSQIMEQGLTRLRREDLGEDENPVYVADPRAGSRIFPRN